MADRNIAAEYGSPFTVGIISEWVSYTATGSLTTNTTYTGKYRRVGDSIEVCLDLAFSGAPNVVALTVTEAQLLGSLGLTVDNNKMPNTASGDPSVRIAVGTWSAIDSGINGAYGGAASWTGGGLEFSAYAAGAYGALSATSPISWNTGDNISIRVSLPIVGWNSNVSNGMGLATATKPGGVGPRRGQFGLTITGTNWTTARAVGIYYQDQDGNHRLKFNVSGSVSAVNNVSLTVSGVTFKQAANFFQAVAAFGDAGAYAYVIPNTSTLAAFANTGTSTNFRLSGDVELESKPTWA